MLSKRQYHALKNNSMLLSIRVSLNWPLGGFSLLFVMSVYLLVGMFVYLSLCVFFFKSFLSTVGLISSFHYTIDYVRTIKVVLNLNGNQKCKIGLKVTAILLIKSEFCVALTMAALFKKKTFLKCCIF